MPGTGRGQGGLGLMDGATGPLSSPRPALPSIILPCPTDGEAKVQGGRPTGHGAPPYLSCCARAPEPSSRRVLPGHHLPSPNSPHTALFIASTSWPTSCLQPARDFLRSRLSGRSPAAPPRLSVPLSPCLPVSPSLSPCLPVSVSLFPQRLLLSPFPEGPQGL